MKNLTTDEKYKEYIGKKFNKLTIVSINEKRAANGNMYVNCKCDCGNPEIKSIMLTKVKLGYTKSCGCLRGVNNAKDKYRDLVGQSFGKLTILEIIEERHKKRGVMARAKCSCHRGKELEVVVSKVLSGITKDCGCGKIQSTSNYYSNIRKEHIGLKYGQLTVTTLLDKRNSNSAALVGCKCDCGNPELIEISLTDLKRGRKTSCGCHLKNKANKKAEENIGQKYNMLTIVGISDQCTSNGTRKYLCKCDCGNPELKHVVLSKLKAGTTKSCGCYRRDYRGKHNETNNTLYKMWSRNKIKCSKLNKNLSEENQLEFFENWSNDYLNFKEWAYLNGYEEGMSLVRKDESIGFTPENCEFKIVKHGHAGSRLYNNWSNMRVRYADIGFHEEWIDFTKFKEWADKNGYTDESKISLIDKTKGFTPENCLISRYYSHGGSNTRLYKIWTNMKDRTINPKNIRYKFYGEKGIKVCKEWFTDFSVFRDWAYSNGYEDREENLLSIDRIDNNRGYNPDNCRWATNKEQANNKTNNALYTMDGVSKSIAQWAEEYNVEYKLLHNRVVRGKWDLKKALTTPIRNTYNT